MQQKIKKKHKIIIAITISANNINYRGRSPGGPPKGRPRGLADFFSVAGTISDGRLR